METIVIFNIPQRMDRQDDETRMTDIIKGVIEKLFQPKCPWIKTLIVCDILSHLVELV